MSERLLALAAAPVARREFAVAPEPAIPPGAVVVQNQGAGFAGLDTRDPIARMMLRSGIGQTVQDTSRLYRLATDAAGWGATLVGTRASSAGLTGGNAAWDRLREAEKRSQPHLTTDAATWRETGWQRFPDGKWRTEIDDAQAPLTARGQDAALGIGQVHSRRLADVLDHPQLFRAHPSLADMPTSIVTPETDRFFATEPNTRGYFREHAAMPGGGMISVRSGQGMDDTRSVLLHEIQHAVQRAEGFAPGTNMGSGEVSRRSLAIRDAAEAELTSLQDARRAWADGRFEQLLREQGIPKDDGLRQMDAWRQVMDEWAAANPGAEERMNRAFDVVSGARRPERFDLYRSALGEAEARAVQARRNWLDTERPLVDPLFTIRSEAGGPHVGLSLWDPRNPAHNQQGLMGLISP